MNLVFAVPEHFDTLWPLLKSCLDELHATASKDEIYEEFWTLCKKGFAAYTEEDGVITGFFFGRILKHILNNELAAHDTYWYVVKEHRNKGIGKLLLKTFESWAKAQGCGVMVICPSNWGNGVSKGILEKMGYNLWAYQMRRKI